MPLRDPRLLPWLAAFVFLMVSLGLAGEAVNPWLAYAPDAIAQGQVWRLVTCHLVHFNLWHLTLNVSGFLLCCYFFADVYSRRLFFWWFCVSAPAVGLLLYQVDDLQGYYMGFSGLLHGWLVVALVAGWRTQPWLHGAMLTLMLARLVWEQLPWYDANYLVHLIDASVHPNAHLYGAACGLLVGLGALWSRQWHTT